MQATAVSGDEMLERTGLAALVDTERVAAACGVRHRVGERCTAQGFFVRVERTPGRVFVISDESARLLAGRRLHVLWTAPIGAERVSAKSNKSGLRALTQTVPVEGRDWLFPVEPNMFRAPVAMRQ